MSDGDCGGGCGVGDISGGSNGGSGGRGGRRCYCLDVLRGMVDGSKKKCRSCCSGDGVFIAVGFEVCA